MITAPVVPRSTAVGVTQLWQSLCDQTSDRLPDSLAETRSLTAMFVYFAEFEDGTQKIGLTRTPERRRKSHNYGRGSTILCLVEDGDRDLERHLCGIFRGHRHGLSPEEFRRSSRFASLVSYLRAAAAGTYALGAPVRKRGPLARVSQHRCGICRSEFHNRRNCPARLHERAASPSCLPAAESGAA